MLTSVRKRWAPGRIRRLVVVATARVTLGLLGIAFWTQFGPGSMQTVVDAFVIGPARTCAEIALPEPRCDRLVERAISEAPVPANATLARRTLHDVGLIIVDGRPVPARWSAGTPFGLVLIEYDDGTRHAEKIGCFGVTSPSAPTDPLCPR